MPGDWCKRLRGAAVLAQTGEIGTPGLVTRCDWAWPAIQHGLSAPILGPTGNIVAYGDGTLFAVGDRANPGPVHAGPGQEVTNGGRAACTVRNFMAIH